MATPRILHVAGMQSCTFDKRREEEEDLFPLDRISHL